MSSGVLAVVPDGASAIGLTVRTKVSAELKGKPFSVPFTVTVMVVAPN